MVSPPGEESLEEPQRQPAGSVGAAVLVDAEALQPHGAVLLRGAADRADVPPAVGDEEVQALSVQHIAFVHIDLRRYPELLGKDRSAHGQTAVKLLPGAGKLYIDHKWDLPFRRTAVFSSL